LVIVAVSAGIITKFFIGSSLHRFAAAQAVFDNGFHANGLV